MPLQSKYCGWMMAFTMSAGPSVAWRVIARGKRNASRYQQLDMQRRRMAVRPNLSDRKGHE
jgi:hypothetical protein